MARHSKRMRSLLDKTANKRYYSVEDAASGVKDCATAKFDETVEMAFFLGVDPRHAEQMVRGTVALPHGTGKKVRVVVFCKQEAQQKAAMDAGAMEAGGEALVEKVQGGWTDFDVAVATPDMMGLVGKLGKVLGPKGLMPSPKAGTVTPNVGDAVSEILKGKIDYRVDKNANIHVAVGKCSFSAQQIADNVHAVLDSVIKARPTSLKGQYIKTCAVSSTMGPGFRIDPSYLVSASK